MSGSNSETLHKVVALSLTYDDAFVFGEHVREYILRGSELGNELMIRMKSVKDQLHMIQVLRIMFKAGFEMHAETDDIQSLLDVFNVARMHVDNVRVTLVVSKNEYFNTANVLPRMSQFSCDVFCLTKDGLRLNRESPDSTSVSEFTLHSLLDIREKTFYHIPIKMPVRSTYKEMCLLAIRDAKSLLGNGWVMRSVPGSFHLHNNDAAHECAICLNTSVTYSNDMCITTICSHTFHTYCVEALLTKTQLKPSCPFCRTEKFIV